MGSLTARQKRAAAATIALCVVLVCLLVWVIARKPKWGNLDYWKATLREDPDEIYARSAGGPDDEAQLALDRTQARLENPRIQGIERITDHFRLSRILRLSFLPFLLDNVNRDNPSRTRLEIQVRRAIRNNREDMTNQLIHNIPNVQRERALQFVRNPNQPARMQHDPEFLIAELAAAEALGEGFWDQLHTTSNALTIQNAEERRNAAAEATTTPAQAADLYLDMAQTHRDDRENSHDPAVTASIRAVAENLRADQHTRTMAASITIDDIARAFKEKMDVYTRDPRTGRPRPLILSEKVSPVIERTKNGEDVRIGEWSVSDDEMLRLVWARSHHPRNTENAHKLRDALFWGLADCSTEGLRGPHTVCVQGRVSRMAGSLALLDFDKDNWYMSRIEDIRNDILEKAKDTLKSTATAIAISAGERHGVRLAAAEYGEIAVPAGLTGKSTDIDEAEVRERLTKAMIDATDKEVEVINGRVPGAVRSDVYKKIREDLQWVLI